MVDMPYSYIFLQNLATLPAQACGSYFFLPLYRWSFSLSVFLGNPSSTISVHPPKGVLLRCPCHFNFLYPVTDIPIPHFISLRLFNTTLTIIHLYYPNHREALLCPTLILSNVLCIT